MFCGGFSDEEPAVKAEKEGEHEEGKADDKGGWKTLGVVASEEVQEPKPVEAPAKPLLQQGFGFGGQPMKYGTLKTGSQLAAKPELFKEEKDTEKKIDMFSVDSDEEGKDKNKSGITQVSSKVASCYQLPTDYLSTYKITLDANHIITNTTTSLYFS